MLSGLWQTNPPLPSHNNHSNDLSLCSSIDRLASSGKGQVDVWDSVCMPPSIVWDQGLERLKDGMPSRVCAFLCLSARWVLSKMTSALKGNGVTFETLKCRCCNWTSTVHEFYRREHIICFYFCKSYRYLSQYFEIYETNYLHNCL